VLLVEARTGGGWQLPASAWRGEADIHAAADKLSSFVLGTTAAWQEQVGAFSEGAHPLETLMSVATVTSVPKGTPATGSAAWHPTNKLPPSVSPRQRAMITAAVTRLRRAVDDSPVAFHLLPPAFTLTELQQVYELLLDRRLHKASFRRALLAADIVVATEEWRSEGRGRPAQLFVYDADRRKPAARAVRFE
jgi:8-oxo-dGTP diphosphatase